MAIIAAPDGSYYSDKTGKTYTREQILAKLEEKKAREGQSLFERVADAAGSLFSGETTTYDQTGGIQNVVQGNGPRLNDFSYKAKELFNANNVLETDSDRAARLREASDILGLNELDSTKIMRGGLDDEGVMKSALALAKKKQSEPDDWEQFAVEHPATIKYLEQQKNMAISYDDVKPLGRLEDTANTVKAHLEMMEVEEKIAELGRKYDAQNMSYNELSADQRVELNDLLTKRKELAGNVDTWSVGNVLGSLLVMKEDLPMALAIGLQGALVGAGAGALAGGVGAIPGAMTGFGTGFRIGMGASMGYRMAGTQYAENMMRADANGKYMDTNSLRQGAWGAGIGMMALGSFGVGRLTEKIPMGQVYDKFLRTTSPSVLNNPAAREAAWKGYLSTLGTGVKEAAIQDVIFGGGTAALTYGTNRYSEALSGLDYSNREDGTLIDNIINGMQQFAPLAIGTGVGFSVGGRMMSNALGGKKPTSPPMPVADGLNKVMNAMDETKTAQRSPQAARDMVNTVFGETASAQDVEINARGLVRLLQEADPENPNKTAEVAQKLGVDEKALNEAVELDDYVRVSVGDFVKEFGLDKDNKNLRAEVLKEVRDTDGMTENQRGEVLTYEKAQFDEYIKWLEEQKDAQYDHNDPAYIAAMDIARAAYPNQPRNLEQYANIVYAGFKRYEESGVLKLAGFDNAEQAIRAVEVRRKDAPDEQVDGLNQAAMYRSKRANNFVEFSQEAKDIKAAHTEKTDKPYLRFIGSGGSEIDIARDDMFHAVNKHKLTDEQLQAIEANTENFVSVYEDTRKKGGRGGTVVLAKVDTPLGKAGVAYEIMPNGRTFLNTMFFDEESKIDNWQQNKKDGSSKIILDESKISTAGNTPSSISRIQQVLGIVNKAKEEKVARDVARDTMELFQSAWHGTPHDFDKFDLGAIGTGEGAQVHGWGLYFAKNRDVSKEYRNALAFGKIYSLDGKDISIKDRESMQKLSVGEQEALFRVSNFDGDIPEAIQYFKDKIEHYEWEAEGLNPEGNGYKNAQKEIATSKAALEVLENDRVTSRGEGSLFEVEIPDDDVLLDEQKPFSEQPEKVQAAINKIVEEVDFASKESIEMFGKDFDKERLKSRIKQDMSGESIYSALSVAMKQKVDNGDRAASELLNQYGVKGITYEGGRDGRCFVVFDDKAVEVINKYNQKALHGTPHDVDRLDISYVGSGSGISAHGYGLYATKEEGVARAFADRERKTVNIGGTEYVFNGEDFVGKGITKPLSETNRPAYLAASELVTTKGDKEKALERLKSISEKEAEDIEAIRLIESGEIADYRESKPKGKVLELEIPDDDVLLDEDKSFAEQPKQVQEALKKVFGEKINDVANMDGKRLYRELTKELGGQKEASEALNKAGIKGIKYNDKYDGDGESFVIFDDKAITILNKRNKDQVNAGEDLASILPNTKSVMENGVEKLVKAEGHAIIELYKNANPSSLAHEMLHHWVTLNELAYKTGKMEGQALEDFAKLAEFAGHELGTEWSRDEHEKLASAWETYLSEGRAPSVNLVGAFKRFKEWMKKIYQSLVRHEIPINDDVRGVFDRMLASDRELALAESFYDNEQLFAGRDMNDSAKREYIGMLLAANQEAEKEMDKRVMAEVSPAMKEIQQDVAKNLREDIAGKMMSEPVYVARSLLTAPVDSPDFQAAKAKTIREKLDERLDLLVKESAKGVEKKGMIAENAKQISQEWFGGFSNNHDWYKEMFARRGGKIPATWYNFIKEYKAGEKTLKQMPKKMREEYEYIANEQLTNGHKDSFYGDIPEDMEYVNLKENTPAMSFIVQNGGGIRLDRASVYERYGKGALQERWLTDKGGYTLDELADYVYEGKAGGDKLYEELTTKPTFAKELAKRVRQGLTEFKDKELGSLRESAIKAIYNEKSMDAVALRAEVFERMAAEKQAKEQQKTAEAMAEGREKAKAQEKVDKQISKAEEKAANKAAREQRWLDAAVAKGTLEAKAAREMAREQVANTKVGEILQWQKYTALANRARKDSIQAMSKGDYDAAIEATNRELFCHAMAKEAAKADTELKKTMRYFDRINRRGLKMNKVPHEFNVQTDNLLAKYNLLSREPLKPLEGEAPQLSQFIKDCEENYFVPVVADDIVNGQPMHYSRLTMQQMQELKQGVRSLQHVGRQMDATVANAKKQSIKDICQSLVEQLATHEKRYALQGEMGQADVPTVSVTSLVKAETLLRLMDKGEENGVFVRNLYNPIKLGLDDYANRSRKIVTDWDKVLADSGWTAKELYKQKNVEHTFDFMPNPKISHEQVILAALNWGNEGNRDRLRYYFMSPEQRRMKAFTPEQLAEIDSKVMRMFEVLTAKDLKLIQAVWDYLETYAPEIRKHEVEVAGVDVKMVEPTAFTVMSADGQAVQMRGGYFPIRYDSGKSTRALNLEEANQLYKQNSAISASTAHGHVKERTNHMNRPLLLEWNTLLDHLRNVNYDLAMRKPIMDVSRILRNEDVQSAIAETFGNEKLKMLQDWVRDIATDQREDKLTFAENAMRWTRTRMSVAYLGFRTKALVIDLPQNFITSVWQNGLDETIKGISQFYLTGDYRQKIDFINARSPMMRDKISFMDANLADLRVSMLDQSKTAQYMRVVQKLAFCCDLAADMAVNAPMWLRFHAEAMKRGLTDAEASLEADAKTRHMSVDTSKAGLSAIQRGGEFKKLVTPFYSYFNAFFNRLYFDYGMARIKAADGQQMDAARLMVRTAVLGVGIPTMIEAIVQGMLINNDKQKDKKKHGEDMMKEAASASFSYLANTVPLAGGVASLAFDKAIGKSYKSYEFSPVEAALTDFASVPANIINYVDKKETDKEAGEKLARSLSRAAAVAVPYPNMINTLALNIWDVISKGDFTLSDLITRRRNSK